MTKVLRFASMTFVIVVASMLVSACDLIGCATVQGPSISVGSFEAMPNIDFPEKKRKKNNC